MKVRSLWPDGGFSLEWVNIAGPAAEGAYVTFFAPDPNQVEAMQPYNDAYKSEYNADFGAFGGASALATFVALDAIESCADTMTRECVVDALHNMNLETTPLGVPVSFDEHNQAENTQFSCFRSKTASSRWSTARVAFGGGLKPAPTPKDISTDGKLSRAPPQTLLNGLTLGSVTALSRSAIRWFTVFETAQLCPTAIFT